MKNIMLKMWLYVYNILNMRAILRIEALYLNSLDIYKSFT